MSVLTQPDDDTGRGQKFTFLQPTCLFLTRDMPPITRYKYFKNPELSFEIFSNSVET